MKGLVLFSDGSYALRDVPEPVLGGNVYAPQDVLIEVAYCGICGSDVHKWKDSDKTGGEQSDLRRRDGTRDRRDGQGGGPRGD